VVRVDGAPLDWLGLLAVLGRHECCAGDHEAERQEAGADREWARVDGFAEDEDAADDRGQVGGQRGERDDLERDLAVERAGGDMERRFGAVGFGLVAAASWPQASGGRSGPRRGVGGRRTA
jgi:hypothetical protein